MKANGHPKSEVRGPQETRSQKPTEPTAHRAGRSNPICPSDPGLQPSDFLVWQLIDSAFPTGGFAHSGGLEAAWQHGEVRTRDELFSFLEAALDQARHNALPFVLAAYSNPGDSERLDRDCEAFTTNHVANRASRLQGRAFLTAATRVFSEQFGKGNQHPNLPFAHFPPVFGAVTRQLGIDLPRVTRLYLFQHLRGMVAAAVRLNIVGPMEAQTIQFSLSREMETSAQECLDLTVEDLAQTSPLLELWQGSQDRLYSRLFQS